jgi:hypothetical protein
MSHVHGVLALGAASPDIQSDLWPVPVRVKGSSYLGQMMVADDSGIVYRLSPGQIPVPVRNGTYHPDDVGVVGLAGGRLLVGCFDDSWSETELVDEATGQMGWSAPIALAPVMPVDDQLIGNVSGTSGDLASLDVHTGLERWRNERWGVLDIIAVVGEVLWLTDVVSNTLVGYDVDSGREVATVGMPRESRLVGALDQSGDLHIGDEYGWLIVDLAQAKVVADVRFEGSGMGDVYAHRTVRRADGRLVLADDRGTGLRGAPRATSSARVRGDMPANTGRRDRSGPADRAVLRRYADRDRRTVVAPMAPLWDEIGRDPDGFRLLDQRSAPVGSYQSAPERGQAAARHAGSWPTRRAAGR